MLAPHHSLKHCDEARNADVMFGAFKAESEAALATINSEEAKSTQVGTKPKIILWGPILAQDYNCQCICGQESKITDSKCFHCHNIGRLSDYQPGQFHVECGENVGKALIVQEHKLDRKPLIESSKMVQQQMEIILSLNQQDPSPILTTVDRVVLSDPFTNNLLISWVVDQLMNSSQPQSNTKGVPSVTRSLKNYTGFICRNIGFTLSSATLSISELMQSHPEQLNKEGYFTSGAARGILIQLLGYLSVLKQKGFIHGRSSLNALRFIDNPVYAQYNNTVVNAEYTLVLADLEQSSINYKNVRLACRPPSSSDLLQAISTPILETVQSNGDSYYRYTGTLFEEVRGEGVPLALGFDFYAFLYCLMSVPAFYEAVMADSFLSKFWSMLWDSRELPIINTQIKARLGAKVEPNEELMGFLLRPDIILRAWTFIDAEILNSS